MEARENTGNVRQAALAVSVLHDIDLTPTDTGVVIPGAYPVRFTWADVESIAAGADPSSSMGRYRIATALQIATRYAERGQEAVVELHQAAVALALPAGHLDHAGSAWAQQKLPGGALEVGIGLRGIDPHHEDHVVALPPGLANLLDIDQAQWWTQVQAHAADMARLATQLLGRDGRNAGVIRPVGGCDVLTLLTGPALRSALAQRDGTGLCMLAVPSRSRAWFTVKAIDPAYVAAVWSIADATERGIDSVLLVTKDEVCLAKTVPVFG